MARRRRPSDQSALRLDWVDYAKGICIIMVVMMHSTLGVEAAVGHEGFMHAVVEFAKPFRMPDFFLISGLFLARVIDRDWRTYLDRKVVHFAYFYVLWVTIQFAVKAPGFAAEQGWADVGRLYLLSFIEPFGTLWFIYLLPIFFVVTKLTQRFPALAIWIVGAALETAKINTGWTVIDEFAARFVYFYSGYLFAGLVFGFVRDVQAHAAIALVGLAMWALVNGARPCRRRGLAAAVARLRFRRLRRGDRRRRADGKDARARCGPLLRRAFAGDLSGVLPADGRVAHAAVEDRRDRRHRHRFAASSRSAASSARWRCGGPPAPPRCASCSIVRLRSG